MHIFHYPEMDISTPGANLWDMHFLEPPKKQKISILHCKMEIVLHIVHSAAMNISTPGANLWDMHFLGPPNMQKKIILQCKMEIFVIFSISQKWISILGQTLGYAFSGATKYAKNLHFTV